jgi:hypothetical protein
MWLRPVVPCSKWCGFLETRWSWCLPSTEGPPGRDEGSTWNSQMAKFRSFYGHGGKGRYDSLLGLVLFR